MILWVLAECTANMRIVQSVFRIGECRITLDATIDMLSPWIVENFLTWNIPSSSSDMIHVMYLEVCTLEGLESATYSPDVFHKRAAHLNTP